MSRFNVPVSTTNRTTNFAGGKSFKISDKLHLVTILLTSFLKDSFYERADETLTRLEEVCDAIPDKQFLAKAAIFARTEFGMRSVSHVVAARVARDSKGLKEFFNKIVYRPDDMLEIASYFLSTYKEIMLPNAMKKGFAKALGRFSEYQLAKYRGEGRLVNLVDIVNLVHPKHTEAIGKLVAGELKNTETWEAKLTQVGKSEGTEEEKLAKKKASWRELVLEKKLGYFALLRNLRNIIEAVPELSDKVAEQLINEEKIKGSLVLPFRYLTAIDALRDAGVNDRTIFIAISKALDISLANVPTLPGKVLIALDISGSMTGAGKALVKAQLFAAALYKKNMNADFMVFSDAAQYFQLDTSGSLNSIARQIETLPCKSGGTNMPAVFQKANKPYDIIVVISDMDTWITSFTGASANSEFNAYKRKFGVNTKLFNFDITGHGTAQFPEDSVYALAGISDKVFDIMKNLCEDRDALIKKIESVSLAD